MFWGEGKMEQDKSIETIQMVINTLNHIEVHGRDNLSRLLGCIQKLDEMKESMYRDSYNEQRENVRD